MSAVTQQDDTEHLAGQPDAEQPDAERFAARWRAWHAEHEARRAHPHGFLAITSIHWLTGHPQRFDDAPGEWSTGAGGVHVDLAEGEHLLLDGQAVRGAHDVGVLPERGGTSFGWDRDGTPVVLEVAKRGGHDILRPRHPDTPLLRDYHGTPTYEPDPAWAVVGRFEPFATPKPTEVAGAVERVRHVYDAPGRVVFDLAGRPHALTVFANEHGPGLFALLTDETSGVTTWPANRSLSLGVPAADGSVLVDFNRATNLPCAYTDLATCPLPPAENRLPVAVEAGEQIPHERR